jgi:hypothetical protein
VPCDGGVNLIQLTLNATLPDVVDDGVSMLTPLFYIEDGMYHIF